MPQTPTSSKGQLYSKGNRKESKLYVRKYLSNTKKAVMEDLRGKDMTHGKQTASERGPLLSLITVNINGLNSN